MYRFSVTGAAGSPPATYPYSLVGATTTSPLGPYFVIKDASIGLSPLQSGHQCAQKKSSIGWPRSAARVEGFAPSHSFTSSGGAGFPSMLRRLTFFRMRSPMDVDR